MAALNFVRNSFLVRKSYDVSFNSRKSHQLKLIFPHDQLTRGKSFSDTAHQEHFATSFSAIVASFLLFVTPPALAELTDVQPTLHEIPPYVEPFEQYFTHFGYPELLLAAIESNDQLTFGLQNGKLKGCEGPNPCVSTSAFKSPSRFLPPWTFLESSSEAKRRLNSALLQMGAKVEDDSTENYIHATLARDVENIDDLEFLFTKGKVVCFRSFSRKYTPDPPFCWWNGCINGPKNRGQLEKLRDELGWVPLETDEEKNWVPLLLH